MRVLGIKEHVCIFAIFVVERTYDFSQSYVPYNEEEPVSNYQLSLPFEHLFALQLIWYFCDRSPMGPVLLEIFDEVCALHPFDKVLQVIQDKSIEIELNR